MNNIDMLRTSYVVLSDDQALPSKTVLFLSWGCLHDRMTYIVIESPIWSQQSFLFFFFLFSLFYLYLP
jgi:hypothetical protein